MQNTPAKAAVPAEPTHSALVHWDSTSTMQGLSVQNGIKAAESCLFAPGAACGVMEGMRAWSPASFDNNISMAEPSGSSSPVQVS